MHPFESPADQAISTVKTPGTLWLPKLLISICEVLQEFAN